MNKVENLILKDKSRIIFDYLRVKEDLLDIYIKLSFKIYDNLIDFYYKSLFTANLKHVYFTIPLHPNNRYFFIFTILDIR